MRKHLTVLAEEAVSALVANPDGIYVDATFGRGGHTRRILERLGAQGHVYAFDRDAEAVDASRSISDQRFTIIRSPFSKMQEALAEQGVSHVNGILMDIGVSSPQIDAPERGFSFRFDGPLDMRMDQSAPMSAADWIATAKESEIERVIADYGEERFAHRIARAIVREREIRPILRTSELAALVERETPKSKADGGQHPATRTFQAIRIRVNDELGELERGLEAAGALLTYGGRLVVISFHSLEDRIVKRFFEMGAHPERALSTQVALRADQLPQPWWSDVERLKPDTEECDRNARARSAVMRSATRTDKAWQPKDGGVR